MICNSLVIVPCWCGLFVSLLRLVFADVCRRVVLCVLVIVVVVLLFVRIANEAGPDNLAPEKGRMLTQTYHSTPRLMGAH